VEWAVSMACLPSDSADRKVVEVPNSRHLLILISSRGLASRMDFPSKEPLDLKYPHVLFLSVINAAKGMSARASLRNDDDFPGSRGNLESLASLASNHQLPPHNGSFGAESGLRARARQSRWLETLGTPSSERVGAVSTVKTVVKCPIPEFWEIFGGRLRKICWWTRWTHN